MKIYKAATIGLTLALIIGAWQGALAAGYRMKIEFPGYTNRTETLTNFPVLVVLSNNVDGSGFSFETTPFLSTNGWDLRFRDSADTTDLNYEIEEWDTSGASYVWVQAPELPADGSGYIWAYWGEDDTQQACTTNGAVWSEGYVAVWHLNETSGTHIDATRNEHNGTIAGNVTQDAGGAIDGGDTFDGNGDYINVGQITDMENSSQVTVSGWIRLEGTSSSDSSYDGSILCKATGDACILLWYNAEGTAADNTFTFNVGDTSGNNRIDADENAGEAGQWQYVSGVMNGTYRGIYVDGSLRRFISNADTTSLGSDSADATIGHWSISDNFDHDGGLDELRVSTTTRSADWVWADYMTVASNLVFSDY
ncbi:MAG: DUF2341 domain-containing protein, partial [Verrucomicrobiota bacterium]